MNDRFGAALRKILDAEIARLTENLVIGVAISDYAAFRHQIGQISALKRVNERYLDEVQDILNER